MAGGKHLISHGHSRAHAYGGGRQDSSRGANTGKKTANQAANEGSSTKCGKRAAFKRTQTFRHVHTNIEKDSEGDLEFQKRQLPKQEFDKFSLGSYICFLLVFLLVALNQRDSNVYNFAQSVREIVQAQWFEQIGHRADYFEYLGVHLFPGLQENSVDRPDAKPFSLVGAPQIRAVRARQCDAEDNGMSAYLDNVADGMLCLIPVDKSEFETASFGGHDGQFFRHSGDAVGRKSYGWEGGITPMHTYPGTGYLVPSDIIVQLLESPVDVSVHGTEFYPFPHDAIDVSVLEESGWLDPQTVVIFHDLTVVSANKEMYCHIRMVLEIGADHGLIKPSVQLSVVFLDDIASGKVLLETVFMGYIIMLIFAEFRDFWVLYAKDGKNELKEQLVERRYRLRQRMLQYAAFQGIMVYNPQPVMKKLMHRLFVKYQDESPIYVPSATHIQNMNQIGSDMMKVHEKWKGMRETGFKPRDETGRLYHTEWDADKEAFVPVAMQVGDAQARQAAMAVIDLFDRVRGLHTLRLKQTQLDQLDGISGKLAWSQIKVRFPMAVGLFFRDVWNFLDFLNYTLFGISIWFRIAALFHDIPKIQSQLNALTDETRYSTYVDFSDFVWRDGIQNNLNAFNAVLTWLKARSFLHSRLPFVRAVIYARVGAKRPVRADQLQIFKYLEVDPKYKMLTATIKKSAAMLSTLIQSFVLVLVGSGQGFFMAFGASLYSFRSFMESILGLLRMAVGDFDYSELQGAQPVLGPLMFWVYIFLVFFVLMSMFIALIAEAFEEAKDEHLQTKAKSHIPAGKLKLLSTKRLLQEAKTRRDLASKSFYPDDGDEAERGMGLVSDEFIGDLTPFDRAVEVFMAEIRRQEEAERKAKAQANMDINAWTVRPRRSSVQLEPSEVSLFAMGEAIMEGNIGSWWDSSRIGRWLRSRLYWEHGREEDKAGHVRHIATWFDEVEMKSKGVEYRAKENYNAETTKELSYEAGNVIVIVKKENDKKDDNGHLLKEGVWHGYRKLDGAGTNRIVRNHATLEKLKVDDFDINQDQPVDVGEDGALSAQEEDESGNESEDEFEQHEAPESIQLGRAGAAIELSSDDDDISQGLTMLTQQQPNEKRLPRRRMQTMFGNPAQAHTYGVDPDIPESDEDEEVSHASGSKSRNQDNTVQQLREANRKVEVLEQKLHRTQAQLDKRELQIERLQATGGKRDLAIHNSSVTGAPEDSLKIKEIHEILSAKQNFEDKIWKAKGGMARAILEDHDKTRKIETILRTVVRKLESIEAGADAASSSFGRALPGATSESWPSLEGDGGGVSRNFVETPSTRLRREEHKEAAAIELQRRREALQTR